MDWQPVTPVPVPPELGGDLRLGRGELEAIALARRDQALLLMDEVYARAVAERVGLSSVGTLGILLEGYKQGHLAANVLKELLLTVERRKDIWIDPELCRRLRRMALRE